MKTILITGATDGIGFETAKLLAAEGHYLLLHGRSNTKMKNTIEKLSQFYPATKIDSYLADLSNFEDMQSLVNNITAQHSKIDVIINNAGVMKLPKSITQDGLDARFVVNTLAPVFITNGLLSILSEDGRIVNLSSAAQSPVNVDVLKGFVNLNDDMQAYAQSKLALTIWSKEMATTLKSTQVIVAVNPGSLLASKMVKEGFGMAGNDLSIGANILVEASLDDKFADSTGLYFDNDSGRFSDPHQFALKQDNRLLVINAIDDILKKYC